MIRGPLAAAAALILACACVPVPDVQPVSKPVDDHALGLDGPSFPAADSKWWRAFGDPQLDTLVDDALARSPSLDEALARVRVANAQSLAAGAPLRPGLTLDGELSRQRLSENYQYPPKEAGVEPFGGGVYWMGQLMLNFTWDLDFWGRQAATLRASEVRERASVLEFEAARLALAGAIAQAYVQLDRAWSRADIAHTSERQRNALLHLAKTRFDLGLGTQLDVRNAEALVATARLDRLEAQSARDTAEHQLAALTARGANAAPLDRPHIDANLALPLPQALPMDLLAHRPDVLAARLRVEAAGAAREASGAAFYPDVSLRAFAGTQAFGLGEVFESGSRAYGVGPALHLPIFESRRLKAGYLASTGDVDVAIARYNAAVLDAVRDVRDGLSRTDILQGERVEAAARLTAAESAYQLAFSRFRNGLTSQLPVLDAEAQVLSARRGIIDLDSERLIARVSLLLRLGGSFVPPQDGASP